MNKRFNINNYDIPAVDLEAMKKTHRVHHLSSYILDCVHRVSGIVTPIRFVTKDSQYRNPIRHLKTTNRKLWRELRQGG